MHDSPRPHISSLHTLSRHRLIVDSHSDCSSACATSLKATAAQSRNTYGNSTSTTSMGSRSVQDSELQRALRIAFGKPMCYGEILQRGQAAAMQTRSEYTRAPNRQQAQYRNSILRDQREALDNDDEGEVALLQCGDNPDDRLSGEHNNTARKQQLGMYSVDLSVALGGSRSRRSSVAGGQPVAFPDDACKSSPNLAVGGGGIRINFSRNNTGDLASCLSPTQASQQGSSMLLRLPSSSGGAQPYRRSTTGGTGSTLLQGSSAAGPLRPSITGAGSASSAQPSPRPSSSSLMSSPSGPLATDSIFSDRSGSTSCVGPATIAFASTPMRPRGLSYSGTGAMPRVSSFQAARRSELLLHQLLVNKEGETSQSSCQQT